MLAAEQNPKRSLLEELALISAIGDAKIAIINYLLQNRLNILQNDPKLDCVPQAEALTKRVSTGVFKLIPRNSRDDLTVQISQFLPADTTKRDNAHLLFAHILGFQELLGVDYIPMKDVDAFKNVTPFLPHNAHKFSELAKFTYEQPGYDYTKQPVAKLHNNDARRDNPDLDLENAENLQLRIMIRLGVLPGKLRN